MKVGIIAAALAVGSLGPGSATASVLGSVDPAQVPAGPAAHAQATSTGAITLAVVLIAINALFVAAEFALVRARPARLRALAREGDRGAAGALGLVERLTDTLAVCQVGITLCGLALGYIGEPAFAHMLTWVFSRVLDPLPGAERFALPLSIGASFLLVTVLLVVLGEIVPKRIAVGSAERIAALLSLPIRVFALAFKPLVWALNGLSRATLRLFGLDVQAKEAGHSRDEIRQLLALSMRSGEFGTVEATLLDNLFRFSKRRARDAMVPRARVIALDLSQPVPSLLALARNEGYSRYPLIERDLDHVVGIVLVKELANLPPTAATSDLRRITRPALIVPDTLSLDRLLRRFQAERAHFAVVADEYAAVVGIVTLEDVLEELVGELRDEFDVEEQDPVRPLPGGGFALDPALPVDRVLELVGDPPEPPEGVHTLAGLLQAELGRIPNTGDRVPFGAAHELVAAAVQGTRILRVELLPHSPPPKTTTTFP